MKRKKTVPAEVVPKPVNDAAPVPEKDHPLYDRLFVVGFAVLLFFAMTVQTVPMSLILAAVALVLSFGRGGYARFRGRLGIPVLGFLAFLILCGAASLYTSFGAYAYGEYAKLLASGALGLLLLARGREQNAGGLLFGFSAVCGVIGLLCIDAGCRGPLFRGFASFMEGLGDAAYQSLDQATYTGARFDGIYNDANLTGSLMALAVLVGLYLIRTGRKPWERFAACFLTGLSAVAFFTAMSRGAILCFGATLLAYLLIAGKEERLGLFFTMAAMGISMVIFGVVSASLLAGGSFWGTLAALPSGVLLWLLNEFPARKAASALAGHGKLLAGVLGGGIAAGIAAVVLALTLTEPFVFTESNFLYRGADVEGGETYTFSGDWDKSSEITVLVYGSTREQELTSVTETYYNGPLEEASFTVPEDVGHVLMQFRGPAGLELRQVSLSDGTEIPMAYTLLPDNIANRLQKNIFEDSSFLLRLQYDIDGWTLFKESPLAGHGLGATEGLLTSVQPFFYESLYLHNHLLQVMDETGLLGLAAFMAFILNGRAADPAASQSAHAPGGHAAGLLGHDEPPRPDGDLFLRSDVSVCGVFPAAAANSVLRNLYRGEEKAGRRYCGPGGVGPVAGDFCCPAGRKPAGPKGISGAGCCRNDDRLLHRDTGKAGPHGCIQRSELQGESDGECAAGRRDQQ